MSKSSWPSMQPSHETYRVAHQTLLTVVYASPICDVVATDCWRYRWHNLWNGCGLVINVALFRIGLSSITKVCKHVTLFRGVIRRMYMILCSLVQLILVASVASRSAVFTPCALHSSKPLGRMEPDWQRSKRDSLKSYFAFYVGLLDVVH